MSDEHSVNTTIGKLQTRVIELENYQDQLMDFIAILLDKLGGRVEVSDVEVMNMALYTITVVDDCEHMMKIYTLDRA